MEKKIYCVIGERCKCIKYTVNKQVSDVKMIRRCLDEACTTDLMLNMMMCDKYVILQKKDSDRNNQLRDIEDDEEVEDKSDVNVVLLSIDQSMLSNDMDANPSTSNNISSIYISQDKENLDKNESNLMKAEVIFIDSIAEVSTVEKVCHITN